MSRPFVMVTAVLNDMLDEDDIAMLHALGRHANAHRLDEFLAQGSRCRWCAHPIRLRGYVLGDKGEIVFSSHDFPDNVVLKACGSRSELRRPRRRQRHRRVCRNSSRGVLDPHRPRLRWRAPGELERLVPLGELRQSMRPWSSRELWEPSRS